MPIDDDAAGQPWLREHVYEPGRATPGSLIDW